MIMRAIFNLEKLENLFESLGATLIVKMLDCNKLEIFIFPFHLVTILKLNQYYVMTCGIKQLLILHINFVLLIDM